MKARDLQVSLTAAIHAAINHWIDSNSQEANSTLKLGGITVTGPKRLKVQLVDNDFKPHTYNVFIEETR